MKYYYLYICVFIFLSCNSEEGISTVDNLDMEFLEFRLIQPENHIVAESVNPVFVWPKVDKATQYIFYLARDNAFKDLVKYSMITDTTEKVENLEYLKDYYWRVYCKTDNKYVYVSPVSKFTTTPYEPDFLEKTNINFIFKAKHHYKTLVSTPPVIEYQEYVTNSQYFSSSSMTFSMKNNHFSGKYSFYPGSSGAYSTIDVDFSRGFDSIRSVRYTGGSKGYYNANNTIFEAKNIFMISKDFTKTTFKVEGSACKDCLIKFSEVHSQKIMQIPYYVKEYLYSEVEDSSYILLEFCR